MHLYHKLNVLLALVLLLAIGLSSCSDEEDEPKPQQDTQDTTGTVRIHTEFITGPGQPLVLGETFESAAGDSIRLEFVRYWMSNLAFTNQEGEVVRPDTAYYLIEKTADNTREMVSIDLPEGSYTQVDFYVGVDSLRNSALDYQIGELQVGQAMNWNWNTGYIFWKQEGTYFNADSGKFVKHKFHLGLDTNLQMISTDLSSDPLIVEGGKKAGMLHYMLNVAKVYKDYSLMSEPNVVMVGPADKASALSDQVGSLFMLHHKENANE